MYNALLHWLFRLSIFLLGRVDVMIFALRWEKTPTEWLNNESVLWKLESFLNENIFYAFIKATFITVESEQGIWM